MPAKLGVSMTVRNTDSETSQRSVLDVGGHAQMQVIQEVIGVVLVGLLVQLVVVPVVAVVAVAAVVLYLGIGAPPLRGLAPSP